MEFKIPFTGKSSKRIKKAIFVKTSKNSFRSLAGYLKSANAPLSKDDYIELCLKTFLFSFALFFIIFAIVLGIFHIAYFYLYALALSFLFSCFILFSQLAYPRIYSMRKAREIEKNLIPAMQDMLIQLNSGIPIFKILVNIANSNYSEVSTEFSDAVEEINSGKPQIAAIDEIADRNTSLYFKRVLWQISNGMRAGSDMSIVIKDSISTLEKEQIVQLQSYGNSLNPLVMFYMLLAVILPSLALTFLTIISSLFSISGMMMKLLFIATFVFVIFLQFMFLGLIKTRRPSLL